jgi:SAM-dependent methyltransferase
MKNNQESRQGRFYRQIYEAVCGKHPRLRPWHFQWLATIYLSRTLRHNLPKMQGNVLDVGCGDKPYRELFSQASSYVGIDVYEGGADFVVAPDAQWPFDEGTFDVVFATQVIEHVENLPHTLGEVARVCKPGGVIVLSFPFLYNEHGTPYDFQRFTSHGAACLLPYEIQTQERQGGFGSTVTMLTMNWINDMLNTNKVTRLIKALVLPIWVPLSFAMNGLGLLLDAIDGTNKYYNNNFIVFRKPLICAPA